MRNSDLEEIKEWGRKNNFLFDVPCDIFSTTEDFSNIPSYVSSYIRKRGKVETDERGVCIKIPVVTAQGEEEKITNNRSRRPLVFIKKQNDEVVCMTFYHFAIIKWDC